MNDTNYNFGIDLDNLQICNISEWDLGYNADDFQLPEINIITIKTN